MMMMGEVMVGEVVVWVKLEVMILGCEYQHMAI